MKELQPCGTTGAYQRHVKRGEEACTACKAANAAYAQQRRRSDPAVTQDDRRHRKVRGRALTRLADRHWEEYRRLFAEEWDRIDR